MFEVIIAVLAVVILFLFSIRKFSKNIQEASGKNFKRVMRRVTRTPFRGTVAGAGITSIIQSSSATTVILVGLVHAGIISFRNSLGVIFGANIGTTVTSQLIAFNLTAIAPFLMITGFFIEVFGRKYKIFGRPIFYFGLIFFSLSLLISYMDPISSNPQVLSFFENTSNVFVAIALGFIFTLFVQSSSITSGLAVVLVGGGLLGFVPALGIILGANIGTTTTSIVASLRLGDEAKKTAVAHFLFNLIGVLIFLPLLIPFADFIGLLGGDATRQIANAHLIFNVILAGVFLILINPFEKLVNRTYNAFRKSPVALKS